MKKHTKKMMAATMALAITIGGVVWANQYVHAATATADQTAASTQADAGTGKAFGKKGDFRGDRVGMGGMHGLQQSEDLLKLLGVTADDLKTALQSGKSLADVAKEKGVDVQAVIDLIVKERTADLDARVADGKLTQAQADEHKANLTDMVTKMVNGEMGPKGDMGKGPHDGKGGMGMHGMLQSEDLLKLLGVTADDLKTALQSGKSLADVAKEKGVDVQAVIDLQVKAISADLDARVADGKLTQAQADEHKANLTDMVTKMVNGEMGPKGDMGKGPHDGKGGMGMHGMLQSEDLLKLLGVTADDLKTALQSGKSLADVAKEKNVDVQAVIDLIVKERTADLDARVADGKLTQAQADECKANLTDMVTKMVNGEIGPKGDMGKGGHHGGKGGMGGGMHQGAQGGQTSGSAAAVQ